MGIERRQIDWMEPVGIQIRGIRLQSADNYAGGGTPLVTGQGIGIGAAGERTALNAAIQGAAVNRNVEVYRNVAAASLYLGSPTVRGVLAFNKGSAVLATDTVGTLKEVITQGTQEYIVNRVRIRDSYSHDPIEDDNGNEIWGLLATGVAADSPYLVFYAGDPQNNALVPFDIKTITWWTSPPVANPNNDIEIIFNESVEFRDVPYAHNLRDVTNFFDVVNDNANLPVKVYTDVSAATTTPINAGAGETGTYTAANPDITALADGTAYRVGARVWVTDGSASGFGIVESTAATSIVLVAAVAGVADGSVTVYHDITEFTITSTNPVFRQEASVGEYSLVEASVNGVDYIVARGLTLDGTTTSLDDIDGLGTDVQTDWFVDNIDNANTIRLWWLDLGFSNPDARFELEPDYEVYIKVHTK